MNTIDVHLLTLSLSLSLCLGRTNGQVLIWWREKFHGYSCTDLLLAVFWFRLVINYPHLFLLLVLGHQQK